MDIHQWVSSTLFRLRLNNDRFNVKAPVQITKIVPWIIIPILIFLVILLQNVPAPDWYHMFRPAAQAFIRNGDPYVISGFFNPPWALLGIIPFALLPPALSASAFFIMEISILILAGFRYGAKPWAILLLFLSPFTIQGLILTNLDVYVAIGMTFPPLWGLFFILLKPQVSIGLVLFWLAETWRSGKITGMLRVFGPVTAAFLISFVAYGMYFLHANPLVTARGIIEHSWPYSIPFGIILLSWSIYKRQADVAALSGFLLTPYISISSYWLLFFILLRRPKILLIAVFLSWPAFIFFSNRYF